MSPQSEAEAPAVQMLAAAAAWRRVHPQVSHDVATHLGANSLRRYLISRNADTLSIGLSNVE
eukprot:1916424-Pleurochrysis_carterae.AAC.4